MGEQAHRTAARVSKNVVAQAIALLATTGSKLLLTIIIGRLYGVEAVGEFAFVMTFGLIFTFLSTAGIPFAIIREVATHRPQAHVYAENGLTIVTSTGLLAVPVMVLVASLLGRPPATCVAVGLVGLALVFDGLAQVVCGVFNGFERMELGSAVMIVQELAFLIIGAAVLVLHLPLIWLFAVYVPSRLAGFVVAVPLYHGLLGRSLRAGWDWHFIRMMLRLTMPYAANLALGPVYLRIDVVMLTLFHGNAVAGLYEAAGSIFYRLNVFARTINSALLPLMAREFEMQADRIRIYVNLATKYQVAIGMPLTVACIMLAAPIMNLLYGGAFAVSSSVFALMATIITLRFIDNTLATALTAVNLQSKRSTAVALMAVLNVSLNLLVLPKYGFVGAAATTIVTELCFFGLLYLYMRQKVSRPLDFSLLLRPAIAGIAMGLVLWMSSSLPVLLSLLLGSLAYLVFLFALGTFSEEEIRLAAQVVHSGLTSIRDHRFAKRFLGWI